MASSQAPTPKKPKIVEMKESEGPTDEEVHMEISAEISKVDKDIQVNFFHEDKQTAKTFVCNRFIYCEKNVCDAEIQTEIFECNRIIVRTKPKNCKDSACNTE